MTKIDYNSPENQRIIGKLVDREVLSCMTSEVEDMLSAGIMKLEDIENLYESTCPHCGETLDGIEFPYGCTEHDDTTMVQLPLVCPNCGEEVNEDEICHDEMKEIYEWWLVTSWLYKKLLDKGEAVYDYGYNQYWGRCTTGQAILLDYVMGQIADDMKILENQENSWATK